MKAKMEKTLKTRKVRAKSPQTVKTSKGKTLSQPNDQAPIMQIAFVVTLVIAVGITLILYRIGLFHSPSNKATHNSNSVTENMPTTVTPEVSTPTETFEPTPSTIPAVETLNIGSDKNIKWKLLVLPELGIQLTYPTSFTVKKFKSIRPIPEDIHNYPSTYYTDYNYEFTSINNAVNLRLSNEIIDLSSLNKKGVKTSSVTISPFTYTIIGIKRSSAFEYMGEGVPCSEDNYKASSNFFQDHIWNVDAKFSISYRLSQNYSQCDPKDNYEPSPADKAAVKKIIESIKYIQ